MSQQGYIQLTRECNQDCRFCSNPANENRLDPDTGRKLIDSFSKKGYTGLIFTGGEPTLSPLLPELLRYAAEKGIPSRIITNGQKISDASFFKELYDAGLRNLNVSIYSYGEDVQNHLSGNPDSLKNIKKTLKNLSKYDDVQVVVNTVINKYNSSHLSATVEWVLEQAPYVRHFVWNNLDPRNSKVQQYPDTVARLNDFQLELFKAVKKVLDSGRTCRVERVPLCYMTEFEHLSTETRKIVKNEKTSTYFLDQKGLFSQESFSYGKAECCSVCTLDTICAGLFEMDAYYFSEELYACFVDREKIIEKIMETTVAAPLGGGGVKGKRKSR